MMSESADEILTAALRFATARLQALDALTSADELADAFGIPRAAAGAAAVAQHLNAARVQLGQSQQSLNVADVGGAANHLVSALNESEAALNAVNWGGPNPGLTALINLVRNQAVASSGLLKQLGLEAFPTTPAGIAIEDGALVYRLERNTPVSLSVGVARLTLGSSALTARLRLTSPVLPSFGMTLAANDAEATVGDDVVRVFYLANTGTVQEFQEVATLVRSIGDIRYTFTYNAPKAAALRGTRCSSRCSPRPAPRRSARCSRCWPSAVSDGGRGRCA